MFSWKNCKIFKSTFYYRATAVATSTSKTFVRRSLRHLNVLCTCIKSFELCWTPSWRRSLWYRNQSIDLQSKSIGWLLYNRVFRHKRVKANLERSTETHLEPSQTSNMELFAKIINGLCPLITFAKNFIWDVWLSSDCSSE